MSDKKLKRRDFIKAIMAGIPVLALDWNSFPTGNTHAADDNTFDVIIIGSGLGGLSCGAAIARQGFRPLILEQHYQPGGYATTFKRPGGFEFDVSLHSTVVGERDGIPNLIPGFPEIKDVEFVPHPNLYRAIFPDYDFRVPQKDVQGYIKILADYFPKEEDGLKGLIEDMQGLRNDINKLMQLKGNVDMSTFPADFPHLFKNYSQTWGQMVDARLKDEKLKALVSVLWGYYGLPPSRLASFYYAMPTIGYLEAGGYYAKGKSQKISNAFVKFINEHGGKVLLNSKVTKILMKDSTAYGVETKDGKEYTAKVIVSNANAYSTFHTLINPDESLKDYMAKMDTYTVSLSLMQVFLGLKKDLVSASGIKDTEIFVSTDYDVESDFLNAVKADVENCSFGITLYDNIYKGYSPKGKNILTLTISQGYDHWKEYEEDYLKGKKTAYKKEKERMANILIKRAEKALLPGLSKAIEIMEIGTPLTNMRYTGNYRGAVYGWDQTLDNSMPRRMPITTPIKNLYLASAWTQPGGGYGGVIASGLMCFAEIMKHW
jgi:all-trans-retinol 13,14-reductase